MFVFNLERLRVVLQASIHMFITLSQSGQHAAIHLALTQLADSKILTVTEVRTATEVPLTEICVKVSLCKKSGDEELQWLKDLLRR